MNIFNTIANFFIGVVVTGLSIVGIDTPLTPPTLTLSASPASIQIGSSSTIQWSSDTADECVSKEFDTEGATSGETTVSPSQTTTYSVTCSKTKTASAENTGVWREYGGDVTDLWCTSRQPSFRNFYTENPCSSNAPEGQSCSPVNELCAVNKWQTKGGTVGDLGSQQYCNLITTLYKCVSGTGAANSGTTGTSVQTVFSGEFGDLVAPHLKYRKILEKDARDNGGIFSVDGFYDDKATANRVCEVLFPGSTNGTYRSDKYSSPKNNTVMRWDGSKWTQQSAKNHPRHLRYSFTCVAPSTAVTLTPTPETKSVTKSITIIVVNSDPDTDGDPSGGGSGGGSQNTNSGIQTATPQCDDGIDNNGDGLIDYPNDPSCASANGAIEVPIPDAELSLVAVSNLVQQGKPAKLTWTATNVANGSCTISGSDGSSISLSGTGDTLDTAALEHETNFTLQCTDLRKKTVSVSVTVKIVPSFQEI